MLDVAIFDAAGFHVTLRFGVFLICDAAVNLWKFGSPAIREVLTHEAEKNITWAEGFCDIFKDALGVFNLSWKNEMADDDAFFEKTVCAHFIWARLAEHLLNGGGGFFKIIGSVTVPGSRRALAILEVRQPDLDLLPQKRNGVHAFVAATVVYDGDRQWIPETLENGVGKVGGRHQIDVVRALGDELTVNLPEPLDGDFLPLPQF